MNLAIELNDDKIPNEILIFILFLSAITFRHFSFPKRKVAEKKKAAQAHRKINFQFAR